MKFAEFHEGQVIEAGPYEVREEEVLQFARAYDPQWFHTDPEAAARERFGGSEPFASPGLAHVKWPNPGRPGDALSLRATVLDVHRSRSQPELGILNWRWQVFNQQETEVLDPEATSLFWLAY